LIERQRKPTLKTPKRLKNCIQHGNLQNNRSVWIWRHCLVPFRSKFVVIMLCYHFIINFLNQSFDTCPEKEVRFRIILISSKYPQMLFMVFSKGFKRFHLATQEKWPEMSKNFRKNEVLSSSRILWGMSFSVNIFMNVAFSVTRQFQLKKSHLRGNSFRPNIA